MPSLLACLLVGFCLIKSSTHHTSTRWMAQQKKATRTTRLLPCAAGRRFGIVQWSGGRRRCGRTGSVTRPSRPVVRGLRGRALTGPRPRTHARARTHAVRSLPCLPACLLAWLRPLHPCVRPGPSSGLEVWGAWTRTARCAIRSADHLPCQCQPWSTARGPRSGTGCTALYRSCSKPARQPSIPFAPCPCSQVPPIASQSGPSCELTSMSLRKGEQIELARKGTDEPGTVCILAATMCGLQALWMQGWPQLAGIMLHFIGRTNGACRH